MTPAPILQLVPLDARQAPPEQLVLRPVILMREALTAPPAAVRIGSRRVPCRGRRPVPVAARYAADLETWRAPRGLPIRPVGLAVLALDREDEEIRLPRSRKRRVASSRALLSGDSHETLTNQRMTRQERAEHALDLEILAAEGVALGMPVDDRHCPPGPCSHIQCRHHLYIDVKGKRLTLNFPGRHIDEIPGTCSLRVARAAAARRQESNQPDGPAMTCAEVGAFMNLTAEAVRRDEKRALAKLRAAGIDLW